MSDELFRPSLSQGSVRFLYSTGALIAAAFFGGAFAVLVLAGENSRRARRLGKDLGLLLAAAAVVMVAIYGAIQLSTGLRSEFAASDIARVVNGLLGVALAGLFFQLHRPQHRAIPLLGIDRPSPVFPVTLASVAGVFLMVLTIELAIRWQLPIKLFG